MFFSYGLVNQNLQILKFFDKADGIRRLYNVVSTLKILQADPAHVLDTHAEKTCAKMASVCILRYLEQHLIRLADQYGIPRCSGELDFGDDGASIDLVGRCLDRRCGADGAL